MPRTYEEIIEEILAKAGQDRSLMEDPSRMEDTMSGGLSPNSDMVYNPQRYTTMNPPPRDLNPRYLDKLHRRERFDDTQTDSQKFRRDRQLNEDVQKNAKIQEINPDYQSDDERLADVFPVPPPPPPNPNAPALPELYKQMPGQRPPQSNMPMTDPQDFMMKQPDMYQLMEFYTGGGQVET